METVRVLRTRSPNSIKSFLELLYRNNIGRKMISVIEILVWLIIASIVLFISNTIFYIRTAASIFLSFLVASFLIYGFYRSIFGEIVVMFTIVVGLIYAFSRAIRDKRDDAQALAAQSCSRTRATV